MVGRRTLLSAGLVKRAAGGNAPCRLGRCERRVSFLVPASDPGLISAGCLRHKSDGCNKTVSVILLFISSPEERHLEWKAGLQLGLNAETPELGLRVQLSWSWGKRR
jgi:hypothetical protein